MPPDAVDQQASLAQSVERETLNLKAAGSTPAWGFSFAVCVWQVAVSFWICTSSMITSDPSTFRPIEYAQNSAVFKPQA